MVDSNQMPGDDTGASAVKLPSRKPRGAVRALDLALSDKLAVLSAQVSVCEHLLMELHEQFENHMQYHLKDDANGNP